MPTYALAYNMRTERDLCLRQLSVVFDHASQGALNLQLTNIAVTQGGQGGDVTITTTNTIPAEQRIHLELT
jgi:hypothetical protein